MNPDVFKMCSCCSIAEENRDEFASVNTGALRDATKNPKNFIQALQIIVDRWGNSKLDGIKPASEKETHACKQYLENQLSELPVGGERDSRKEDVTKVLDVLIENNVPRHYSLTASHRQWIINIYELVATVASIKLSPEVEENCKIHDLSKYGTLESLGYGIMFGQTAAYRTLEGEEDELWKESLQAHYNHNPHHPQYFGDKDMPIEYVEESIIDMIASRTERTLRNNEILTPSLIFEVEEQYLTRYTEHDREIVRQLQINWRTVLEKQLASETDDFMKKRTQWEEMTDKKLRLTEEK